MNAVPGRVGRFELRRELGRGAQAVVWLAHDPRVQRDVALKCLLPGNGHPWLDEARAAGRLAHPNVVPLFEADEADGRPFLVFEFVDGPTLAQRCRARGRWPAHEAATLMLGVLDAIAAAHAQGLVHRDLKPSNVLLGADGRPRVMDFGVAARIGADGATTLAGAVVGTPGYLSPEAARGEAPGPAMDVFAAGVVLGELLAGRPLLDETDVARALARVQAEDLALPADLELDDALRSLVQTAVAREPARRFASAVAMREALAAWLARHAGPAETNAASHATLEFLLRRMRHKTDFPALSDSVLRIQRIAASDSESLASLCGEVMKDVALTHKLLRMVNTVHFAGAGRGERDGVGTVSRAVSLIGFAGVRNLALSVLLLEHMGDKAHAAQLRDEYARALMAGTLAAEMAAGAAEAEDAFLGSMFQNLGRLLTEYYFPDEAQQVRERLPEGTVAHAQREAAASQVLGLGFEELGVGVARAWGLPETLQRAMRAPDGDPPTRPPSAPVERLRWLGRGANAVTDALLLARSGGDPELLNQVLAAHAGVLGRAPREVQQALQRARERVGQLALALGLPAAPGATLHRLLDDRTLVQPRPADAAPPALPDATATLQAALRALDTAPGPAPVGQVLQRVLDTLHRALGLRCAVFALRDVNSGTIAGRLGVGEGGEAVREAFRVVLADVAAGELFAALCTKGADTLIHDTAAPAVAARLPAWYRASVRAGSFLLLPMMRRGVPVGLLYGDTARPGGLALSPSDLALVRALRDQALAALERAGARAAPLA